MMDGKKNRLNFNFSGTASKWPDYSTYASKKKAPLLPPLHKWIATLGPSTKKQQKASAPTLSGSTGPKEHEQTDFLSLFGKKGQTDSTKERRHAHASPVTQHCARQPAAAAAAAATASTQPRPWVVSMSSHHAQGQARAKMPARRQQAKLPLSLSGLYGLNAGSTDDADGADGAGDIGDTGDTDGTDDTDNTDKTDGIEAQKPAGAAQGLGNARRTVNSQSTSDGVTVQQAGNSPYDETAKEAAAKYATAVKASGSFRQEQPSPAPKSRQDGRTDGNAGAAASAAAAVDVSSKIPQLSSSPGPLDASLLRDHNYQAFQAPEGLGKWMAGTGRTAASEAQPKKGLAGGRNDADASLFRALQARHAAAAHAGTLLRARLPEPEQISAATKSTRKQLDHGRQKKRRRAQDRLKKRKVKPAKRAKLDEAEEEKEEETRDAGSQDGAGNASVVVGDNDRDDNDFADALPLPSLPRRQRLKLDSSRLVVQYTVFRTRRMRWPAETEAEADVGDDNAAAAGPSHSLLAAAHVIRCESFLDKHRANRRAAALLPAGSEPSVARLQMDYGVRDAERDGMFFGQVLYTNGEAAMVYVDRETQQFGKMDPGEYEDQDRAKGDFGREGRAMGRAGKEGREGKALLRPEYAQLVLMPRYDVFVFMRKPLDGRDGNYVVYEYDEGQEPEAGGKEKEEEAEDDSEGDDDGDDGNSSNAVLLAKRQLPASPKRHDHKDSLDAAQSKDNDGRDALLQQSDVAATAASSATTPSDLGSHFVHVHEGSFMTLDAANARAVSAFAKWTRPQPPARLDAVMYYRDVLHPYAEELRQQFCGGTSSSGDGGSGTSEERRREVEVEIVWKPRPQLRYGYDSLHVVVFKSQTEGPLDLTGAFL